VVEGDVEVIVENEGAVRVIASEVRGNACEVEATTGIVDWIAGVAFATTSLADLATYDLRRATAVADVVTCMADSPASVGESPTSEV